LAGWPLAGACHRSFFHPKSGAELLQPGLNPGPRILRMTDRLHHVHCQAFVRAFQNRKQPGEGLPVRQAGGVFSEQAGARDFRVITRRLKDVELGLLQPA
jgi:hypothetical protein